MKKVVVDASVVVKWFIPEIHSASAARLLDSDVVLHAPDLVVPEFGNILWKKVRRDEVRREDAGEILRAFSRLPIEFRSSAMLLPAAFELAITFDRTVYDSLYLALAVAEDCAFVTADAKYHAAVAASSLAQHVQWVEDHV